MWLVIPLFCIASVALGCSNGESNEQGMSLSEATPWSTWRVIELAQELGGTVASSNSSVCFMKGNVICARNTA